MLEKKLKEYLNAFGESFPMIPLAWGRNDSEIVEIIEKCLITGKSVYDMGLLSEDDDIIY